MDLFIIAAEPSADLLGSKLVDALLEEKPNLAIGGVLGPHLRKRKITPFFEMENLQVMGFVDVLLALPKVVSEFYKVRKKILQLQPKAVVFIDYPGFNLRLAASLKKKGFKGKLIHYVAPTVWAWGKKRIFHMEKNLDLLLTLFPFEKKCFEDTSLRVEYVGHPLVDVERKERNEKEILALFPGSRSHEIEKNLILQLEAASNLFKEFPKLLLAISVANEKLIPQIEEKVKPYKIPYSFFLPEQKEELISSCKVAIAKSGTITLELSLHKVPTIVTYAVSKLDTFIVRNVLKIILPYYCLVNIILNEEVYKELFGPNLTIDTLSMHLKNLWTKKEERNAIFEKCQRVENILGKQNGAKTASKYIISLAF